MASKTYIFKDRFTMHDLFSAAQPHGLMDDNDAVFVVQSAMITLDTGDNVDVGNCTVLGNGSSAAAESGDTAQASDAGACGDASGPVRVNNIIDTYRLTEMTLDKKGLVEWAKPFFARVKADLEARNPGRVEAFVKGAQKFMLQLSKSFDDWMFYIQEEMDFEANICFARFREGATVPEFYFFRDGLVLCFPGTKTVVSREVAAREGLVV